MVDGGRSVGMAMHNFARHRADDRLPGRAAQHADVRVGLAKAVPSLAAALVLAGCATSNWQAASVGLAPDRTNAVSETDVCRAHLVALRGAIAASGSGDAQDAKVTQFPYLRVNRLLAHVGRRFEHGASGPAFPSWVNRLRKLDRKATRYEVENLSDTDYKAISRKIAGRAIDRGLLLRKIDECAERVSKSDLASAGRRRQLVRWARVEDHYSDVARTAGLFPLTSIAVSNGWENWKRKHLKTFDRPLAELPVVGKLTTYGPAGPARPLSRDQVRRIIARSRDRHLAIPEPSRADLTRLFQNFAPVWQIDVAGQYDRIGHPALRGRSTVAVIDQARPTVFTRASHTVIDGHVLLQLNYGVWFSERPKSGNLDLLGGKLDGVIWRVTLAADGRPLVYDSIHACGCYHFVFPSRTLRQHVGRNPRGDVKERPAILNIAPVPRGGERVLLRLATASHYLVGLGTTANNVAGGTVSRYRFASAQGLRS
ncbi:MAG: hypothetical protein ACR2OV_00835, partial [Hyphomicrobiaceae bacterium]